MNIETLPVTSIKPYPGNPRKNADAVAAVRASIEAFGFRQPIVVDRNMVIVVGHTRYQAALEMGLTAVPVLVAADLTDDQARAYRIADNQTNTLSEWDPQLLAVELDALQAVHFDIAPLGFDTKELQQILSKNTADGDVDPDDVPLPPDAAVTKPGDIIQLGRHRLMCGDSGSVKDLDALLAGERIHLVNTDPPYNVKVEPRSNNAIAAGLSSFQASGGKGGATTAADAAGNHHQGFDLARHKSKSKGTHKQLRAKDRPLANDFVTDEAFDKMLDAWFGNIARVLVPGGSFYIWGGYANLGNYPPYLRRHELYFSQGIVWDKQHPVLTRKDFMGAFELAFYGWREGAGHRFFGEKNIADIWHVKKVNPQSMVHLTEKPVELAVRAMQYSSLAGENVLDLFGGSGSTLIAAEQTGRRAFLMELDTLYCDVIVSRFEKFTGTKAVRPRETTTAPVGAGAVAPTQA